jgi:hypothetical protein
MSHNNRGADGGNVFYEVGPATNIAPPQKDQLLPLSKRRPHF